MSFFFWRTQWMIGASFLLCAFTHFVHSKNSSGPHCKNYASQTLKKNVTYCLQRSRPELQLKTREPVVYFFHGINGSSKSWQENGYSEALEILSGEENFPPFTVVSFDTSALSFFSDAKNKSNTEESYESWFIREFLPYVERTHRLCNQRECRYTAGISMGGLGALKTALRHPHLFHSAAANSPALAPFNAHNPFIDWLYFFNRHPVGPLQGQALLSKVKEVFPTREYFDEHDASVLVDRFNFSNRVFPSLYFDCGGKDYFGFQEGFFRLETALKQRGFAFHSHFEPEGTHDMFWDRRWWLLRWLRDRIAEAP